MNNSVTLSKIYSNLIFFAILIYAYLDYINSTNSGVRNANRISVHIMLIIIIIMLGKLFLLYNFKYGIKKDSLKGSVWLITIWIPLVGLIQETGVWDISVHFGLSLLWILVYHYGKYYISKFDLNSLILKWIKVIFTFYVFATLSAFYNMQIEYGRTPVVNLVYYSIVFFPFISFISIKRHKYIMNIFILLIVLFSFKRGAIIIYPLMLTTSFIIKAKIENKKVVGIVKILLASIIFICALLIVDNFVGGFITNRFTIEALESGSGRSDLYKIAYNNIQNRSLIDMIIGLGSSSSVQLLGTGVHNEWIEFAFSYGIIGVALYLRLLYILVIRAIRYMKIKSMFAPAYTATIVYIVVIGLFGGLYFVHSTLYVMLYLGIVEGLVDKEYIKEMNFNEENRDNHFS